MRIGIVIPEHADMPALESLLGAISGWPVRPAEIIVVSPDSDTRPAVLCERHGAKLLTGPANRGAQLDIGARACSCEALWFLHASAEPHPQSLPAIAAAIGSGAESGCFRFAFAGPPAAIKRMIAALANLRVRLGGVAYGDQGLFATTEAYEAAGGFARAPLFEEVSLVRGLRRRGTFRRLDLILRASPRRFERDGWIRRSLLNRWLSLCYMVGVPAERLATGYRNAARSEP